MVIVDTQKVFVEYMSGLKEKLLGCSTILGEWLISYLYRKPVEWFTIITLLFYLAGPLPVTFIVCVDL